MIKQEVTIKKHSGIYTLKSKQILPITIEKAWEFFSNPENLSKITPPEMKFEITSGIPQEMFSGQLISYRINIFPIIKSNWITEITNVKQNAYFIDEQRFGPYKMWHHEHHFKEINGKILMTDKVSYKIPLGFIGHIVHSLFIQKKLFEIFNFRAHFLEKHFEEKNN